MLPRAIDFGQVTYFLSQIQALQRPDSFEMTLAKSQNKRRDTKRGDSEITVESRDQLHFVKVDTRVENQKQNNCNHMLQQYHT
jgi:hypothetical protein